MVPNSAIAGFLQLAGGTNAQTVQGMRTFGFCQENFGDVHVPKGFLSYTSTIALNEIIIDLDL
jgi:hypothetical protein